MSEAVVQPTPPDPALSAAADRWDAEHPTGHGLVLHRRVSQWLREQAATHTSST